MLLWVLLLAILPTGLATGPVKDFRVSSMSLVVSKSRSKSAKTSSLSGVSYSSTSNSKKNSLSVSLGGPVLPLWTDLANSIYYVNVSVGELLYAEDDAFPLLLDTGSGISWIMNESCSSDACSNAQKFEQVVKTASTFSLSYSGSVVQGSMVDTAANGIEFALDETLITSNYSFGISLSAPSFFENYNLSGILGVQAEYKGSEKKNLIHQLYSSGAISSMEFAVILGDVSSTTSLLGGVFLVGDAVSEYTLVLAKDDVQYCDVIDNDQSYWMLNISSVYSNDVQVINASREAIIDTGTTGLSLPQSDAESLHEAAFGSNYVSDSSGNFAFLCNATGNITFIIDDHEFQLPVSQIRALAYETAVLAGYCASKVQGNSDLDSWILGAGFLSQFYTVFDLAKSRVGFATRASNISIKAASATTAASSTTANLTSSASSLTSSSASNTTNSTASHTALAASLPTTSKLILAAFGLLLLS